MTPSPERLLPINNNNNNNNAMTNHYSIKTTLAFWAMGVFNNMPYTVMLAGAKSISEGGTALVFLADVMPGLLVKLSSPYWFEKVSYRARMAAGSILMTSSFVLVATFGHLKQVAEHAAEVENDDNEYYDNGNGNGNGNGDLSAMEKRGPDFFLIMQLIGVACCSAQTSLGEATLLALSGKADSLLALPSSPAGTTGSGTNNGTKKESKAVCITAFSSGTGLAGVLGFAFVVILTDVMALSLTQALYIALIFPFCYFIIYAKYLSKISTTPISSANNEVDEEETMAITSGSSSTRSNEDGNGSSGSHSRGASSDESIECCGEETELTSWSVHNESSNGSVGEGNDTFYDNPSSLPSSLPSSPSSPLHEVDLSSGDRNEEKKSNVVENMTFFDRLKLSASFWPYMVPLFIVYAAEYALQSGVWTAIGFPVDDEDARASFYQKGNWSYQAGVFISRSSGTLFQAPMWLLWLMPLLQCVNLGFFYFVAVYHFWYNNLLLIVCFYVGLLGGGVYVNGYMRVNSDLPVSLREFALSTVSVADSLGIVFADFSGLFIQSCLYKANGINGAVASCPLG